MSGQETLPREIRKGTWLMPNGMLYQPKVCLNWQRDAERAQWRLKNTGPDTQVAAYPVPDSMLVVDCDNPEGTDGGKPDGFALLSRLLGSPYGSVALPDTWAVATPSGGLHLYYKLPVGFPNDGLKNGAHIMAGKPVAVGLTYISGIPVDLRTPRSGYVIFAGSKLPDGRMYRLVSGDTPVATVSRDLLLLFGLLGYATDKAPEWVPRPPKPQRPAYLRESRGRDGFFPAGQEHRDWDSPLPCPQLPPKPHNAMQSHASSICAIAVKYHKSQKWIDASFENLRAAIPAAHMQGEPMDFAQVVDWSCKRDGITTNAI